MDDDIDDKDDTKRYVFCVMNKFHVYLLKPNSVKDGEIKWSCYISSFKKEEPQFAQKNTWDFMLQKYWETVLALITGEWGGKSVLELDCKWMAI